MYRFFAQRFSAALRLRLFLIFLAFFWHLALADGFLAGVGLAGAGAGAAGTGAGATTGGATASEAVPM